MMLSNMKTSLNHITGMLCQKLPLLNLFVKIQNSTYDSDNFQSKTKNKKLSSVTMIFTKDIRESPPVFGWHLPPGCVYGGRAEWQADPGVSPTPQCGRIWRWVWRSLSANPATNGCQQNWWAHLKKICLDMILFFIKCFVHVHMLNLLLKGKKSSCSTTSTKDQYLRNPAKTER